MAESAILEVKNLSVHFSTSKGSVQVLKDVSINLGKGEIVGIVGESGSGKSVTSLAIMDLLPSTGRISSGEILFKNQSVVRMPDWRGKKISMIFQDPMTSLNPCFNIEYQLLETLKLQTNLPKSEMKKRCVELLEQVGIPDPVARLKAYPHQLSGGLAQRVMIAMAIAGDPEILIADEPTTALDVTIQSQILSLLRRLQRERNLSVLLISHDVGVISQNSSRMYVMYAGQVVEEGLTSQVIQKPRHPYTEALLECLPARHMMDEKLSFGSLPSISGLVPSLYERPTGCQFHPRCRFAQDVCRKNADLVYDIKSNQKSLCYFPRA